jgi:hypothetical protein
LNIRGSKYSRSYCFDCGTPWPSEEEILCPTCGGSDRSSLSAKPLIQTKDEFFRYSGPWSDIPWPKQGTVALYGGPGTGKSSLSALIKPKYWLTKEQEPKPASLMFRRLTPDCMPEIIALDSADEVGHTLSNIEEGPVVVDSLTAFGLKDSLAVAHHLVNWSRSREDRALGIIQSNQGGGAAGYLEIPHLFDAVINVQHDPWGVRVFRIEKSRWCGLQNTYFSFDEMGKISAPIFEAAYSVEGAAGSYYLHPFPVKGAKWSGLLSILSDTGVLKAKSCSSAQIADYMPHGFIEPMDVQDRKKFAEKAGLKWISPDKLPTLLPISTGE